MPSAIVAAWRADDAAAEDDDFGGRHARHAAEQNAAPARLALETMGTDLRRQPAGDFRHRREQRQAARGRGHRLVGDAGRPRGEEVGRLLGIGGEMQIGEQHLPAAQQFALAGLRLLHFHDQVAGRENRFGLVALQRPGRHIFGIGEARADTGAALDENLVPVVDELGHRGRRQSDAEFIVFDLFGYADAHQCFPVVEAGRRPAVR